MSSGHLVLFLVDIFQAPLVYTATLVTGFSVALLLANAMVGIIRRERR
jgi:hypothetical protein